VPRKDSVFHGLRADYGAFYLAMYPKYDYVHFQQQIIAPALNELTQKNPEYDRLGFFLPFGHAKSTGVTVPFPAFYLGHHPDETVMCLSYNSRLVKRFGGLTRDLMKSPLYEQLFPEAQICADTRAKDDFATVSGGHYYGSGFDGTINGSRVNLLIVEDSVKGPRQARSEAWRQYLRDLWTSIIDTRSQPNAAQIFVTTRWTPDDLPGWRISEDGGWDALRDREYTDEMVLKEEQAA